MAWNKGNSERVDVQQEITDSIIRAIETGAAKGDDWRMPWHAGDGFSGELPVNLDGKAYHGLNIFLLWAAAMEKGYTRQIWGTYKGWEKIGGQVNRGEKSTLCFFWSRRCKVCNKIVSFSDRTHDSTHRGEVVEYSFFCAGWKLFNIEQLATVPEKFSKPVAPVVETPQAAKQRIADVDKYFTALGATVKHGGNRAFYSPGGDFIGMPVFDAFNTPEDYYSTSGHEHMHWSGHKSRCDRDLNNRFGTEAYAMEELVAELGAAFLCAQLGISNEPRPDHAQYIAGWLKKLNEDKTAIFTAAKHARLALAFLNKTAGDTAKDDETEGEALPIAA